MSFREIKFVLALIFLIIFSGLANAQNSQLQATVKSLQGTARTLSAAQPTQDELRTGSLVRPWDSVSVDEKSKLLLSWKNGLLVSIGELSDMSFAPEEMEDQEAPGIQITNGIFRFATQQPGAASFSVDTPLVSIYPATDGPIDFLVEVYTPESTLVTALSGQVRIRRSNGEETIVPSCHNVLIEQGKVTPDLVAAQPEDIMGLVEATTIPGTIVANLNECGLPATAQAVPVQPPPVAFAPDYYIEDWDVSDEYPFFEVSVLPPAYPGANYIAVIPGIGRFAIYVPFAVDPAIVNIYIQEVFFQRGILFCRNHLAGMRLRQRELARLVSLARMSGDFNLLRQSLRRLDEMTIRANWAARRISRLDRRLTALQGQQRSFSGRLPHGADLSNLISASLSSPSNMATRRKFDDRLRTDVSVQTRLANMAGQEIGNLRSRIAREPNLGKRLAMRQELSRIRGDVAGGQALIPRSQRQVDSLVKQLAGTENPDKRAQLQNRLAGQLRRYETPEPRDFPSRELATLKRDLNKIPNQQGREAFHKQLTSLEQSIGARKQAELNAERTRKNVEDLSKRITRERSPERRNELLGQLNDLSKSMSSARPGSLQFLEEQRLGKTPAIQTKPRAVTGTPEIQKPLERQPLERARQQHQLERQKQTEQQLQRRQLEGQKQTEKNREELLKRQPHPQGLQQPRPERQKQIETRQQELQKQQSRQQELRQRQLLERQKALQQQTPHQQLQRRQIEGNKQLERHRQELQKQQTRQQELRRQQPVEGQKDVGKRQLELQRQQTRQQELHQGQLERQKQQQELQRRQASQEQAARQQQRLEQQRNQQIRQQQLQQEQARQRQLQEQRIRQQQLQQQTQERQRQMRQQQQQQQQQQIRQQQLQRQETLQRQLQQRKPQAVPRQLPKKQEDEKKPR